MGSAPRLDAFTDIRVEVRDDGVARLILNRPQVLNAFRGQTIRELNQACGALAADEQVRVVVLSGAGDRAFCAGGDLSEMSTLSPADARAWARGLMAFGQGLRQMPKPVLAAVSGHALGGGCEMLTFVDLVVATEEATFTPAGVPFGLPPLWGACQYLPLLVGERKARELIFMARPIPAPEAVTLGLINIAVPAADFPATVESWCQALLAAEAQAMAAAKQALNSVSDLVQGPLQHATLLLENSWQSPVTRARLAAVLGRRKKADPQG